MPAFKNYSRIKDSVQAYLSNKIYNIGRNNRLKDTNKDFSCRIINMQGLQDGGTVICDSDAVSSTSWL